MYSLGDDGSTYGAVLLRVTLGTGIFAGATGIITSNFRATGMGKLLDTQVANINLAC